MTWRLDPGQIEVLDDATAAMLRTKTPAERVAMTAALNRTARLLMAAGERLRHPEWTEEQVQAAVVARMAHGSA